MAFPCLMVEFDGHPITGNCAEAGKGYHLEGCYGVDGMVKIGDGPMTRQVGQGVGTQ